MFLGIIGILGIYEKIIGRISQHLGYLDLEEDQGGFMVSNLGFFGFSAGGEKVKREMFGKFM